NCNTKPWSLCAYKNEIPNTGWEFLWNTSGPFYKTGGWDSSSKEYKAIIKDIFTNPHYAGMFASHTLKATAKQLTYIRMHGEVPAETGGSTVLQYLSKYYPHQRDSYLRSAQNNYQLNMDVPGNIHLVVFIIVTLMLLLCIKTISGDKEIQMI